jgi:hypothetical protein
MRFFIPSVLSCLLLGQNLLAAEPGKSEEKLDRFNTSFSSASKDEADSVPLGNGVTGVNLWVEENGDLLFYISRNDAFSEMHRLLKLGRLRLQLFPNPFAKGLPYRQELKLRDGRCDIVAGAPGQEIRLSLFVDAESQTIYLSGTSEQPLRAVLSLENWRKQQNDLRRQGSIGSTWIYREGLPPDQPALEAADELHHGPQALAWLHRNASSPVKLHVERQGLQAAASLVHDPILNRIFGARVSGEGFSLKDGRLEAPAQRRLDLRISTHSALYPGAGAQARFLKDVEAAAAATASPEQAMQRTSQWWNDFWNRSWIHVSSSAGHPLPANLHSLRFGADSRGGTNSLLDFTRFSVYGRAFDPAGIRNLRDAADRSQPLPGALASDGQGFTAHGDAGLHPKALRGGFFEAAGSTGWNFPEGLTLEAWVKADQWGGRLFDKVTPGIDDGLLFDTHGGKLRLIAGNRTLVSPLALPQGIWVHVAAVRDATGGLSLWQDGNCVARMAGDELSPVERLNQAYLLTRYQFACQERSEFPAHFNGGIFTVAPEFAFYATDPRGKNWSADYRFYGPSYWWQNTRFMYQLHLAQGNFDLTDSFFDFYFRQQELFAAQAKIFYGAEGIYMNETLSLFGLPGMGDFGWGAKRYSNNYTENIWQQCLEFGAFALDRYDYRPDPEFLRKTVSWCDAALRFYDTRFQKNAQGQIVIHPTHAVETYWLDVTNDMPSVAGLHEICSRLLALPESASSPEQRQRWARIRASLPPLPKTRNKEGLIVPDNAESYNPRRFNYESPDLNCVYPFRLYGLERPGYDIEEARRAWRAMPNPGHCCWYQTGIIAARLGLAEGAKEDVLLRSGAPTRLQVQDQPGRSFRFPGFFSSPHDWCPDYDGAGNMANTLQEMLLQPAPQGKILLLPAWPKDWDVDFKLHAPGDTTVECRYRDGKILKLEVTPSSRRKDLVLPTGLKEISQ